MRFIVPVTILTVLFRVSACEPSDNTCKVQSPIPPPIVPSLLGGGLAGFDSPYLGHTGSWDGAGGGIGGSSKNSDLDLERSMGLRWTFMPAYWQKMEPDGPVDLAQNIPREWGALDDFVVAAHDRGLNILMQAPVMGGNAGGPPSWAGLREEGHSAPLNMEAAADFAKKLAHRYRPGGTLALAQGWGVDYGIRAWELDNEPETYKIDWNGQAGDYAEFVTKVSAAIRQEDGQAVILSPGLACCFEEGGWLDDTLDPNGMKGSPTYEANNTPYSIGPNTDVVSFHVYEGMNSTNIECAMGTNRSIFESWEGEPGFEFDRKEEYWHTEGNYDFLHNEDEVLRARWFPQMFTRAFAAGVRKVNVMDATPLEQIAVATYISLLPNPFPMVETEADILVLEGDVRAFRHDDLDGGSVRVLWARGLENALVSIPTTQTSITLTTIDGMTDVRTAVDGWVTLALEGDEAISEPIFVVDRPHPKQR